MARKEIIEMEKTETPSGETVFNRKVSPVEELEESVWQFGKSGEELKKKQERDKKIIIAVVFAFIFISIVLFVLTHVSIK